jgi:hypothetical protein
MKTITRSNFLPGRARWPHRAAVVAIATIALITSSVYAATITVTSTSDSGPGTLRAALASAANGDTVDATGVSGTILLTSGELVVTNSLALLGPGPDDLAVNGNFPNTTNRVFHIGSGKTVTIVSLTVTNGLAEGSFPSDGGGGIYNEPATLTVSNCTISGNHSSHGAGGILNKGTLTIIATTVSGNSTAEGSIHNYALLRNAALTIYSSTVNGNSGAGIKNEGQSGTGSAVIANCTISGNGGGIQNIGNFSGNATMTIADSTISGTMGGPGIYSQGRGGTATVAIANCTISGNSSAGVDNEGLSSSATLTIANSTVSSNSGGGILNIGNNGTLTIIATTVDNNSANSAGGILNFGLMAIDNCTISGNSSVNLGGGIHNAGSMAVSNSTIDGNSASWGGGIANERALTVRNCTLSVNSAPSGGGFYNVGSFAQIANSTFSGNIGASGSNCVCGGGISNGGAMEIGNTVLSAGASGNNIVRWGGTVTSRGYNLSSDGGGGFLTTIGDQINIDPMLGPLQDNGGPTFTHAPSPCSLAIDKGKRDAIPSLASDTDQRGFPRPVDFASIPNAPSGDGSDIGAFEAQENSRTVSIVCPANTNKTIKACSTVMNYSEPIGVANCGTVTSSCSPTNGATFVTGSTLVTCTAIDAAGVTANCSFTVTVKETAPPTIQCPGNITTNTCNSTAVVTFTPTAKDNCPGVTTSCTPASGSAFPQGITTVTCTATDRSGNSSPSCSFKINVTAKLPTAPGTLAATAGIGQITLTWKASAGTAPITYNVKRGTKGGAETPYASGITTTSYTDTTVVKGTKYFYVVTATNCKGESPKSNEVSATPK